MTVQERYADLHRRYRILMEITEKVEVAKEGKTWHTRVDAQEAVMRRYGRIRREIAEAFARDGVAALIAIIGD